MSLRHPVFLMILAVKRALSNATAAHLKYRCADVYTYIYMNVYVCVDAYMIMWYICI